MWVTNVENSQSTNKNTNNGCLHKYKKKILIIILPKL